MKSDRAESGLNQKLIAGLSGCLGINNPTRRLSASCPGIPGGWIAILGRDRLTCACRRLGLDSRPGLGWRLAESSGYLLNGDIVFLHGTNNRQNDRFPALALKRLSLFAKLFDFFLDFCLKSCVVLACHVETINDNKCLNNILLRNK